MTVAVLLGGSTFLKECGSFAHTIFPGKRFHLRTQLPQVNATFAHIRFSQVNGIFASFLVRAIHLVSSKLQLIVLNLVAPHLRTFLKECGSFVHTIFPGKRFHLRTQFFQVNFTFAHIRFSQVNGIFASPLFQSKVYIFLSHFQS